MAAADQKKPREKKNIDRPSEDLISGLSVLKKSIGIYPAGHPSVNLSVIQVLNLFKFIFTNTDVLTIIAAKNSLIINGNKFDKTSRHFADFAGFLNLRGIAAITFTEGLTGDFLPEF